MFTKLRSTGHSREDLYKIKIHLTYYTANLTKNEKVDFR